LPICLTGTPAGSGDKPVTAPVISGDTATLPRGGSHHFTAQGDPGHPHALVAIELSLAADFMLLVKALDMDHRVATDLLGTLLQRDYRRQKRPVASGPLAFQRSRWSSDWKRTNRPTARPSVSAAAKVELDRSIDLSRRRRRIQGVLHRKHRDLFRAGGAGGEDKQVEQREENRPFHDAFPFPRATPIHGPPPDMPADHRLIAMTIRISYCERNSTHVLVSVRERNASFQ